MTIRSYMLALATVAVVGCGGSAVTETETSVGVGTTVPEAGTFVKGTGIVNGSTYAYQLFVPKAYTTAKKWPVILALTGGGERGTDGVAQVNTGLGLVVKAQSQTFPAIVLFPQFPAGEGYPRANLTAISLQMLDKAEQTYNVDTAREYLTGFSFGSALGFQLAFENPTRFAAYVSISSIICDACITGLTTTPLHSTYGMVAQKLKALPIWMFHGARDTTAPVAEARNIVAAFQAAGDPVKYTEFPTLDHIAWDAAYASPDLYTWLYAQHR